MPQKIPHAGQMPLKSEKNHLEYDVFAFDRVGLPKPLKEHWRVHDTD